MLLLVITKVKIIKTEINKRNYIVYLKSPNITKSKALDSPHISLGRINQIVSH